MDAEIKVSSDDSEISEILRVFSFKPGKMKKYGFALAYTLYSSFPATKSSLFFFLSAFLVHSAPFSSQSSSNVQCVL